MKTATIEKRLENWGRCQRSPGLRSSGGVMLARESRGSSPYGGAGYQCMTAVICHMMAVAANTGGPRRALVLANVDERDGDIVNRAWQQLPDCPRNLLRYHYVMNRSPSWICRQLKIKFWPASRFTDELAAAQRMIELAINLLGN